MIVAFCMYDTCCIAVSCWQVELKLTKRVYAMKVIKKDLVLDEEVGII